MIPMITTEYLDTIPNACSAGRDWVRENSITVCVVALIVGAIWSIL